MQEQLYTENEIVIQASPANVWNALINPELTKVYMFGCEVISNWKIGDPVIWKGAQDGITYVAGNLVIFDPEKKLAFTVIDPHAGYEDIPENYLTATYTLTPKENTTLLHVSQGDYSRVQDGEKRYQDSVSQGGWQPVLESIKQILENNTES